MQFYYSAFIVAFIVVALVVGVACAPEIREFFRRFRRPQQTERHRVRPEEEPGPRPPRPDLKRPEAEPKPEEGQAP